MFLFPYYFFWNFPSTLGNNLSKQIVFSGWTTWEHHNSSLKSKKKNSIIFLTTYCFPNPSIFIIIQIYGLFIPLMVLLHMCSNMQDNKGLKRVNSTIWFETVYRFQVT